LALSGLFDSQLQPRRDMVRECLTMPT
jgi:hypothetical protein